MNDEQNKINNDSQLQSEDVEIFEFQEPTDEDLTEEELSHAEEIESKLVKATTVAAGDFCWQRELYEWSQSIAVALVLAFIINQFFFSVVMVSGKSMEETLHGQDRLIVSRFMYTPKYGDIVVVKPNEQESRHLIKRVIALPGQVVDIQNDIVSVDGVALDEPYIVSTSRDAGDATYPLTVKEGHYFVMGDNRGNSLDSRFSTIGQIPYDRIYGKAVLRIFPFDKFGGLYENFPAGK